MYRIDCVEWRRERAVKKREEERREWIGFDTTERIGWWERGTRARQFNATSSGSEGIRFCGGGGGGEAWSSVAIEVDM